ncbi:MAG: hypothetical protein JWR54_979 [Mucilaginibacter sp.]|nr:hypothetical protein [Mucilaginibacter sp.]
MQYKTIDVEKFKIFRFLARINYFAQGNEISIDDLFNFFCRKNSHSPLYDFRQLNVILLVAIFNC